MAEQHIVYAVVDRGPLADPIKVRVSEPLAWGEAIDSWEHYDNARYFSDDRNFILTASHMPVRYFAVRSADDPTWPADGFRSTVRAKITA